MADNPFLPLSFIAGPAILTNASAVLLNGASIRYNLAIGLWRDLQSDLHGHDNAIASPYADRREALALANHRVKLIVRALNFLYFAVGGFGFSTLTGLAGALMSLAMHDPFVDAAKTLTVLAGGFGLLSLLAAAAVFVLESRCTMSLLHLGLPQRIHGVLDLPEGG
jgi:hypothetical protein